MNDPGSDAFDDDLRAPSRGLLLREARRFERRKLAPPVPCTAIYTRSDGIVAWQASLEGIAPNTANAEVRGSHLGLVVNREALAVIAQVMAADGKKLSDGR